MSFSNVNSSAKEHYDVIVAGGGTAGIAAAVSAARNGARTLLVERNRCLGGASTLRNVVTYCGLYTLSEQPLNVVGGVGAEVVETLRNRGALTGPHRHRGVFAVFDPETVKHVLDEIAANAKVDVHYGAVVIDAKRDETRIRSITVAHSGGMVEVTGTAFVDCTGDGDLLAFGNVKHRYGNPDGVNLATLGTRFGGIAVDTLVTADDIIAAVAKYDGATNGQITKDRSVIARLPISGDLVCYLASAQYDPRDLVSHSEAEREGRRQAWRYLDILRTIDGCEQAYLVSTGPEFGTREARHLESVGQITWSHIQNRHSFSDCIALGAWGAEWHDQQTYASSFDYPPDKGAYEIPLSCLTSQDTQNLWVAGRLSDGDRLAGAAIRVMGTAFALGQAAGTAAAIKADERMPDGKTVRAQLRRDGAYLDRTQLRQAI